MFSGRRRRGDLESAVASLAPQFPHTQVWVESYDLVLAEHHNLLSAKFFQNLLTRINRGEVQALLGGPPCSTWSAARHLTPGPPPLRFRDCPWGKPSLTPDQWRTVSDANELVFRFVGLCFAVWRASSVCMFEHPRDRGVAPYASVFNTELLQWLAQATGARMVHFSQCCVGPPLPQRHHSPYKPP